MNIRGLYKTSLLDFPGKVSTVIFTGGCNMRCGYCHNPHLVINPDSSEKIEEDELIAFLKKRGPLLDAITISGGEPLLRKRLFSFISRIKEETPLLVKLDTNGLLPQKLSEAIDTELIDYFAMDMKTSPSKYAELAGVKMDFGRIVESANILKDRGVEYELRTTCIPGYAELEDIKEIGEEISGVKNYYLQQYVNTEELICNNFMELEPYSTDHLESLRDEVLKFSENCTIRGA